MLAIGGIWLATTTTRTLGEAETTRTALEDHRVDADRREALLDERAHSIAVLSEPAIGLGSIRDTTDARLAPILDAEGDPLHPAGLDGTSRDALDRLRLAVDDGDLDADEIVDRFDTLLARLGPDDDADPRGLAVLDVATASPLVDLALSAAAIDAERLEVLRAMAVADGGPLDADLVADTREARTTASASAAVSRTRLSLVDGEVAVALDAAASGLSSVEPFDGDLVAIDHATWLAVTGEAMAAHTPARADLIDDAGRALQPVERSASRRLLLLGVVPFSIGLLIRIGRRLSALLDGDHDTEDRVGTSVEAPEHDARAVADDPPKDSSRHALVWAAEVEVLAMRDVVRDLVVVADEQFDTIDLTVPHLSADGAAAATRLELGARRVHHLAMSMSTLVDPDHATPDASLPLDDLVSSVLGLGLPAVDADLEPVSIVGAAAMDVALVLAALLDDHDGRDATLVGGHVDGGYLIGVLDRDDTPVHLVDALTRRHGLPIRVDAEAANIAVFLPPEVIEADPAVVASVTLAIEPTEGLPEPTPAPVTVPVVEAAPTRADLSPPEVEAPVVEAPLVEASETAAPRSTDPEPEVPLVVSVGEATPVRFEPRTPASPTSEVPPAPVALPAPVDPPAPEVAPIPSVFPGLPSFDVPDDGSSLIDPAPAESVPPTVLPEPVHD